MCVPSFSQGHVVLLGRRATQHLTGENTFTPTCVDRACHASLHRCAQTQTHLHPRLCADHRTRCTSCIRGLCAILDANDASVEDGPSKPLDEVFRVYSHARTTRSCGARTVSRTTRSCGPRTVSRTTRSCGARTVSRTTCSCGACTVSRTTRRVFEDLCSEQSAWVDTMGMILAHRACASGGRGRRHYAL
jgi:hypothetical protein